MYDGRSVCRLIQIVIIHFTDIVSPVSTICHYNIAQVIIGLYFCAILYCLKTFLLFHVDASACKVMATVFWDAQWIVLIDYHGSTITGTY